MRNRDPLPRFCDKCVSAKTRLFTGTRYCKQNCKYNPIYRYTAWRSLYRRLRSIKAGV